MTGPCPKCPRPDSCLRWAPFCAWAAEAPPDPVKIAHIRARSAPASYPPLATQAANLAGSLWAWAVSGFTMASEDEQARRLAICHACPQWDGGRCRICGCALSAKVSLKTAHCPLPEPKW